MQFTRKNFYAFLAVYLRSYIPACITWLPKYNFRWIPWDILAGVVVSAMAIPQGMAYGVLAGLPPNYGLYGAILPAFIYLPFGTSRQIIIGPTAILSLITQNFARHDTPEHTISDALLLSFTTGIVLLLATVLRFGFLAQLIAKPVVTGFTAAAGLIIAMSQFKYLFGVQMPAVNTIIDFFQAFINAAPSTNTWTLLIAVCCLIFLAILKVVPKLKWVPGPLLAVIICTVLSWRFDLQNSIHLQVLGTIPNSLPQPSMPIGKWPDFVRALSTVPAAAGLAFVEHISIAKSFSSKSGSLDRLDANRELFSISLVNLIGSFISMFPATGSFTRTAVNFGLGAKSAFAGVVASAMILIAVRFMTPLLFHLPYAVLAAIICVGAVTLVDVADIRLIWRTKKRDFIILVISFVATLLLGVETGIMLSVGVNALVYFLSMDFMKIEDLTQRSSPNLKEEEESDKSIDSELEKIAIVRPGDSLCFANVETFIGRLTETLEGIARSTEDRVSRASNIYVLASERFDAISEVPLCCLVLDMSRVNFVDTTAVVELADLSVKMQKTRKFIAFTNLQVQVEELMTKSGHVAQIGAGHFFESTAEALAQCRRLLNAEVGI